MDIIDYNKEKINHISINEIEIGDERNYGIVISEDLHLEFGKFSGDQSPIHTDINFCKKNGYNNKLGYAFLLTTVLSQIYGMLFPGGSELCLQQTCKFIYPFYVGELLKYKLKILQKNISTKIITIKSEIKNPSNSTIFEGESILLLSLKK